MLRAAAMRKHFRIRKRRILIGLNYNSYSAENRCGAEIRHSADKYFSADNSHSAGKGNSADNRYCADKENREDADAISSASSVVAPPP